MEKQLVVFELGGEHYGVEIFSVASIIEKQDIVEVPRSPEFVEGVTNLRGSVLPVIDLRRRFGVREAEHTKDTRIIVVELKGLTVGMVVDAVNQVLRIDEADIEPPSRVVATVDSAFIIGIAKTKERLIIVLDLHKVLSLEEQRDLEAAGDGALMEDSASAGDQVPVGVSNA